MTRAARHAKKGLSVEEQVRLSESQEGGDFDPTVLAVTVTLYRVSTVFERLHASELAPWSLNMTQLSALMVLRRVKRPLTMGELAESVSVRSANITAIIDSLTQRNLVERVPNPKDRRSLYVELTGEGEEFLREFVPNHWNLLHSLMADLSEQDLIRLKNLLEKLRASMVHFEETKNGADSAPPTGP